MTRAYVGMGSNLGDSAGLVREALRLLGDVMENSDLYVTKPWGVSGPQPDYINAVAALDTEKSPQALLASLLAIERELGRERREDDKRNAPRAIDLDLLLYGDETIDKPEILVPHPRLRERAFVLGPLAEIAPDLVVSPGSSTASELFAALPASERATIRCLPGTATLTPPKRVDYDAPSGAATGYDDLRPFSPFDQLVLDLVIDAIGPPAAKHILDVGCGTGRFTEAFAGRGALVTGYDASETMLAAAKTRNPAIDYQRGDANETLPQGSWDAITAFYCIQYLDAPAFARRAHAALAAGGTLAIATFPHRHFATTIFGEFFPSLPALDMARFPSVPRLVDALDKAGYKNVRAIERTHRMTDDPSALLARVEAKYLSTFHLLPSDEFARGLATMRDAWAGKSRVERTAEAVVVSGRRPTASQ